MSRKFACLYLAVALLVSSIWIASADERDTVQQEVQYSAAVERKERLFFSISFPFL